MNELHLFAGAGGGILGGILLGHTTVCAVEIEPYCREVLLQRQRDGILPKFPIWDDVRTFDGKPWRGLVDVVCGGFPCQDIAAPGSGKGLDGERSGLWREQARIIGEVLPRHALIENSTMLVKRGLNRVLSDLASMGYDARTCDLSANDAGLPHLRERLWIVADYNGVRELQPQGTIQDKRRRDCYQTETITADDLRVRISGQFASHDFSEARQRGARCAAAVLNSNPLMSGDCFPQPLIRRMDDGMAYRMDRIKAIGNGQVPAVAQLAWETLMS
jgi:DNA (cytosine-5)-methyltransferase 1